MKCFKFVDSDQAVHVIRLDHIVKLKSENSDNLSTLVQLSNSKEYFKIPYPLDVILLAVKSKRDIVDLEDFTESALVAQKQRDRESLVRLENLF